MNSNWNNVFLNCDGVFIISLPVEELLKPGHLVINYFLLCLQLGFKNHITIVIAHDRHWSLAKRIDVNAEPGPKVRRSVLVHISTDTHDQVL